MTEVRVRQAWLLAFLWLAQGCGPAERGPEASGAVAQAVGGGARRTPASAGGRLWLVELDGTPAVEAWLRAGASSSAAERAVRSRARLAELAGQHARVGAEAIARGAQVIG